MWRGVFFFLATMVVAGCSPETIDKILNPPFLTGYGQDVGDNDLSSTTDNMSGTPDTAAIDNDSGGVTDDVPVVCSNEMTFKSGMSMWCGDPVFGAACILAQDPLTCGWSCGAPPDGASPPFAFSGASQDIVLINCHPTSP